MARDVVQVLLLQLAGRHHRLDVWYGRRLALHIGADVAQFVLQRPHRGLYGLHILMVQAARIVCGGGNGCGAALLSPSARGIAIAAVSGIVTDDIY